MSPRILKSLALTAWLCCSTLYISAQCPDSSKLNITATLYTQENGLTSNMLIGTAKEIGACPEINFSPAGDNCWLNTSDKVLRFNLLSKKFQNIPLEFGGEITLLASEPFIPSRSGG